MLHKVKKNSMNNEVEIKKIISELMKCSKHVNVEANSESDILALISKLRDEHTVLFHLGEIKYIFHKNKGVAEIFPQYTFSVDEYNYNVNLILTVVNKINQKAVLLSTDYEREKFIHDYLCKNVIYENIGKESHSIVGPLLKGKGVCDGISKTAKLLLRLLRIDAHVIKGTAKSMDGMDWEPHAWNTVCINGNRYHVDITFDNTISENSIRYDYFNVCDEILMRDHTFEAGSEYLSQKCGKNLDYYELTGRKFYDFDSLRKYVEFCLNNKCENIQVRLMVTTTAKELEKLFIRELSNTNTNASFIMSYNEYSGVCSWEISY